MIHLSPLTDIYIGVLAFFLGACAASFLNCVAWRAVHGESALRGRSHCDVCGHVLSLGDLVPVFSYLIHRGRCRYCGCHLSVRHLIGEVVGGVSCVLIVFTYDVTLQGLEMLLLSWVLLGAAFGDLEGYIIPDRFILAGIIIRIPFYFLPPFSAGALIDSLIGGFAVGGVLLAVVLLYEKIRRVEAMGGGDLKLLFVTGLYLGWAKNILCLLFACVLGIIFALVTGKSRSREENPKIFPWGPSIAAAGIITLLVGDKIIGAYLGLF